MCQLCVFMYIPDEMVNLAADGFGCVLNKEKDVEIKKEIFAKPHPDTLTDNHKILTSISMSQDAYRQKFMNTKDVPPQIAKILLAHHPHNELLKDLLTQPSSDSDQS